MNVLLQQYRNVNIIIFVKDFSLNVIDEISGVIKDISYSVNADSDIRRTSNITMALKGDRSKNGVLNDVYFASGNGYWFDKYVEIRVAVKELKTGENIWYNIGTYLVNEPTINYDATNNTISFQGVDMMSKMTSMRNGCLPGVTTSISPVDEDGQPTGVTITGAMASLLSEQGFYDTVMDTPRFNTVPAEIRVESGSTTYELLSQLRDINSSYEMYFGTDGTFYFQKITDGKNPLIVADDTIWDKLLISYSISTRFEDVKNYVEIYGKCYDTLDMDVIDVDASTAFVDGALDVVSTKTLQTDIYNDILLHITGTFDGAVSTIHITDASLNEYTINCTPHFNEVGDYLVQTYNGGGLYIGKIQPCAVAWEDNPDSPFYVGEIVNVEPELYSSSKEYNYNDRVKFSGNIFRAIVSHPTYDPTNTTCWQLDTTFVPIFNQWDATVHYYGDDIVAYNGSLWLATQPSTGQTPALGIDTYWYKLNLMSCNQNKLPIFSKMVRGVYAGGDFDNVATDNSASEMARYQLYKNCKLHDTITITCVPIYDLDVNRVISITLPNEDKPSYWIVKSINTTISGNGTQTITAMRYSSEYPIFGEDIPYQPGAPFVPRVDLYPATTLYPRKRV